MITLRRSNDRGAGEHGWLSSRHTFSFAGYYDPRFMGFRTLRVINEDKVKPGTGFGRHGHDNMEILSYVLDGALAHEDSTGQQRLLRPGMVQFMSAGTGIHHSEFNGSKERPVHFLQIWIIPSEHDTPPAYEDRDFTELLDAGDLVLLASPDGRDGSFRFHQDAFVYAARMKAGSEAEHAVAGGRGVWIQVASGTIQVNGETLNAGDGTAIEDESALTITAPDEAEFLLFDLK